MTPMLRLIQGGAGVEPREPATLADLVGHLPTLVGLAVTVPAAIPHRGRFTAVVVADPDRHGHVTIRCVCCGWHYPDTPVELCGVD